MQIANFFPGPVKKGLQFIYPGVKIMGLAREQATIENDAWLSLVERCVRDAEVASSNLVASMKKKCRKLKGLRHFLYV